MREWPLNSAAKHFTVNSKLSFDTISYALSAYVFSGVPFNVKSLQCIKSSYI